MRLWRRGSMLKSLRHRLTEHFVVLSLKESGKPRIGQRNRLSRDRRVEADRGLIFRDLGREGACFRWYARTVSSAGGGGSAVKSSPNGICFDGSAWSRRRSDLRPKSCFRNQAFSRSRVTILPMRSALLIESNVALNSIRSLYTNSRRTAPPKNTIQQ
jgi:hypothetical protein